MKALNFKKLNPEVVYGILAMITLDALSLLVSPLLFALLSISLFVGSVSMLHLDHDNLSKK